MVLLYLKCFFYLILCPFRSPALYLWLGSMFCPHSIARDPRCCQSPFMLTSFHSSLDAPAFEAAFFFKCFCCFLVGDSEDTMALYIGNRIWRYFFVLETIQVSRLLDSLACMPSFCVLNHEVFYLPLSTWIWPLRTHADKLRLDDKDGLVLIQFL